MIGGGDLSITAAIFRLGIGDIIHTTIIITLLAHTVAIVVM